jgi:hypothetical protein
MGGEAWDYTTRWEPDLDAALARAQEETLKSGGYGRQWSKKNLPPNPTIADVRQAYELEGSASVLDVVRLGAEPGPEVAGPFADDVLFDLFGTLQPTRAAVMAKFGEILELLQRGEAAYVVVYESGDPREILFVGYTAD